MRVLCLLVLGFALLGHGVSGLRARAQDAPSPGAQQTIRIASEGARPPYNYLDNNELAGFEIDLAKALCARMDVACTFVAQDWDSLIPGLIEHQYDAIMAALDISDELREKIAFSKPYVRMPSSFLVARRNPLKDMGPAALAGKVIGVESGSENQAYAENVYKKSEIRRYETLEDAILDLAEGRIDVAIGDKDALSEYIKTRKEAHCCQLAGDVPRDPVYFGDGIGIGLRKDDTMLKARFDKALDAIVADGTFEQIRTKYFDFAIN